jgi:hypothetical protein
MKIPGFIQGFEIPSFMLAVTLGSDPTRNAWCYVTDLNFDGHMQCI